MDEKDSAYFNMGRECLNL